MRNEYDGVSDLMAALSSSIACRSALSWIRFEPYDQLSDAAVSRSRCSTNHVWFQTHPGGVANQSNAASYKLWRRLNSTAVSSRLPCNTQKPNAKSRMRSSRASWCELKASQRKSDVSLPFGPRHVGLTHLQSLYAFVERMTTSRHACTRSILRYLNAWYRLERNVKSVACG